MEEQRHQDSALPADEAEAQRLTGELRAAIEEVRSAVLLLAARVRAAHRARVWIALGYPSWAGYAAAEFDISRSTAYRLLDLAAATEAIEDVVDREAGGPGLSHAWDTGLVLPVRAVVEIRGRLAKLADLITERLADARAEAGGRPDPDRIGAAVEAAVAELRTRPDVPAAELESTPGPDGYPVKAWRALVARGRGELQEQLRLQHRIGLLALEVAPGYVADRDAEDVLVVLGGLLREAGGPVGELLGELGHRPPGVEVVLPESRHRPESAARAGAEPAEGIRDAVHAAHQAGAEEVVLLSRLWSRSPGRALGAGRPGRA